MRTGFQIVIWRVVYNTTRVIVKENFLTRLLGWLAVLTWTMTLFASAAIQLGDTTWLGTTIVFTLLMGAAKFTKRSDNPWRIHTEYWYKLLSWMWVSLIVYEALVRPVTGIIVVMIEIWLREGEKPYYELSRTDQRWMNAVAVSWLLFDIGPGYALKIQIAYLNLIEGLEKRQRQRGIQLAEKWDSLKTKHENNKKSEQ